jgi:SPP1 gp7 family putative phage head morphogenesis protein
MAIALTKRKEKWVGAVKPQAVKGIPLNSNMSAESRYYEDLENLILIMTDQMEDDLDAFFKEPHAKSFFAQDASISSQARILLAALQKKFEKLFNMRADTIADRMAKDANKSSTAQLKASLRQLSGGLTLKTDSLGGPILDVLKATIEENVSLIKSIGDKYHRAISGAVYRSITTGNGLKELVPFLQKYRGVTLRRAKFIAEDQTRKAFNTLNKARMQQIGVGEYEWLHTSGSQHPRPLHVSMSGNIYRFDKPPIIDKRTGERGIPGQLPNCRCRMVPVIKFNEG